MSELDNSEVSQARVSRAARLAIAGTTVAIFIMDAFYAESWTTALIHSLLMGLLFLAVARWMLNIRLFDRHV
jgi:hypothetical protein